MNTTAAFAPWPFFADDERAAVDAVLQSGRVNYWTPAAERIKGYAAAEIIGQPFATFFMPDDRKRQVPERELEAAREHGSVEGFGWRVR